MRRICSKILRPSVLPSLLILGLLAFGSIGVTGAVQPGPGSQKPEPDPDFPSLISRELARLGHMDLRLQDSPTPEDLAMLDGLLALSQELDPDDPELVRRRVDLAYRLGDPDRLEARTRELVRLDPKDTVAQLRLITAHIAKSQTAEGRMEAYSRYLGPAGSRLDPAIRSRLALDAALLAREQGDEQAFSGLLSKAMQLDSTNKDAAAMAATVFSARIPDDAVGRLELALNLLLADPVDPNVHLSIARQLAEGGAFVQAIRFHSLASNIHVAALGRASDQLTTERLVLAWQLQGPEIPLSELTNLLASQRYNAAVQVQTYEAQGLPTIGLLRPDDIRLGEELERVRVLSAHAAGDQDLLARSLDELRNSLDLLNRMQLSPGDLPAGVSIEDVKAQTTALTIALFQLHAWTGFNMDTIIQRLRNDPAIFGEDAAPILRAFGALYAEGPEQAEGRFRALLSKDPAAWIGLGLTLERLGRIEEAVDAYATVARSFPLDAEGAWARSRAGQLTGQDALVSARSVRLNDLAASVPVWVDRMVLDPSSAMQLELKFVKSSFGPLEPMQLRITLRNATSKPMGLGSDRPIESRMLVSPTIDVGTQQRIMTSLPEVLDMERRLRLNPREEVIATVDVLPAFTGWFMDASMESTGRVRARVTQGFRQNAEGMLVKGAIAVAAQSETVLRTTTAEALMSPQELAIRIEQASEAQLPHALLAARMFLIGFRGSFEPETIDLIVNACAERYPKLSAEARAAAVLILPTPRLVASMQPFEDAVKLAATTETDRHVLAATLLACVIAGDDPILDLPAIQADGDLALIAQGVRARYTNGADGFASAGPGVGALMPQTLQNSGG